MAKNNLKNNFKSDLVRDLVVNGEIQLMQINEKALTGMNNMPVNLSKKIKKTKKQEAHATPNSKEQKTTKRPHSVEEHSRPTYEKLPRNNVEEAVETERNYWQEAIIVSEILGQPVCKRRNRRRSSYR